MAEEIVEEFLWTDSAKLSFNRIISYLQDTWTDKEVEVFIGKTLAFLDTLKRYPEMCRLSTKRKGVRVGILDRHTKIVYQFRPRKRQILILLFWGMKQNPSKFKF